jgi:hypothetical protein
MDAKTLSKQIKKTQKKLLKYIYDEEKTDKYVNKLRRLKLRYDNIIDIEKEEKQKQIADLEDLKKISDELVKEKQEREELEKCDRNIILEEDAHEQIVINPYITSNTLFENMFNNEEKHVGTYNRCRTTDYRLYENITRHDIYKNYLLDNELKDIEDDTELRVNDIIAFYDYNILFIGCITRFTDKTIWFKRISLSIEHHYHCTYDHGQSETFYKVDYSRANGKEKRKSRNSLYHVRSHKKVLYYKSRYNHI